MEIEEMEIEEMEIEEMGEISEIVEIMEAIVTNP